MVSVGNTKLVLLHLRSVVEWSRKAVVTKRIKKAKLTLAWCMDYYYPWQQSNLKPKPVCWSAMPRHCIPSIHASRGLLITALSCCVALGMWHDTHFIQHQVAGTIWSLSQPTWCRTSSTYYRIHIWTSSRQKANCSAGIYFIKRLRSSITL